MWKRAALIAAAAAACLVAWLVASAVLDGDAQRHGAAPAEPGGEAAQQPAPPSTQAVEAPAASPAAGPGVAEPLRTAQLEVTVLADEGPVAGAEVKVYARVREGARDGWRGSAAGRTDERGRLAVGAHPGSYLVTARTAGLAPGRAHVVHPAGVRSTAVEVRLERGAAVAGRTVERRTHAAVPLATVEFSPIVLPGRSAREVPAEERTSTVSDARGSFRLAGVAPGRWRVEARAPGHAPASAQVVVPVRDELVIELASAEVIEGVVLRDGKPAAGATVTFSGSGEPVATESGPTGGFAAEVDPGVHRVMARLGEKTGSAPAAVTVAAGTTVRGVEVVLGAPAAIAGSVRARPGPVAGAAVTASLREDGRMVARAVTATGGAYELGGLAPGT